MGMSSITISTYQGSSIIYSTFYASTLQLPSAFYDTVAKTSFTTSSITASTIGIDILTISTMTVSTLSPNHVVASYTAFGSTVQTSSISFSTLSGDSFVTNRIESVSSLRASSVYAKTLDSSTIIGDTFRFSSITVTNAIATNASFASIQGSTLGTSTLVTSSLIGSSIYTGPVIVSTLQGSTLTTGSMTYNSTLSASTIYTDVLTFPVTTGDTIHIGDIDVPITFANSFVFSTAQGSNLLLSTLNASTLTISSITGSTLQGSTLLFSTLTASSMRGTDFMYSTLQGSTLLLSSITVSTLTTNLVSYSTMSGSSVNAIIITSTLGGSTISLNTFTFSTVQSNTVVLSTLYLSTLSLNNLVGSTLQGSTLVASTLVLSSMNVAQVTGSSIAGTTLFFSTMTASSIYGGSIVFSTLQGSTALLSATNFSTLSASTMVYSTLQGSTVVSNDVISPVIQSGSILFSTLQVSTSNVSTLTSCTINASNSNVSTLQGSTLVVSTLSGSAMVTGGIFFSTLGGSSILANTITANSTFTDNGTNFFSSNVVNASQISTSQFSTLSVPSTLTVSTLYRVNPSSLTYSTITLTAGLQSNTVATSGLSCSSITTANINVTRSVINEPVYGQTVKIESIVNPSPVVIKTSGIYAKLDAPPSNQQIYTFGPSIPNRWMGGGQTINSFAYSYNGMNWTGLGLSIFGIAYKFAWNGSMWVAAGSPGPGRINCIAYSYDGINWTGLGRSIFEFFCSGIVWNGIMWIAVGYGGNSIGYSYDGIYWSGLGGSDFLQGNDVAWNGAMWVAVGGYTSTITYSYDGINWTGLGKTIFTVVGNGIAWNGSMWVAVGYNTNSIAYSYDGINWTGLGMSIFSLWGTSVAWNGSMWIAVGRGTNTIAYSYDGITWIGLGTNIFTSRSNAIAWNGIMWIAAGLMTNDIAYSYDGINWTGLGNGILGGGYSIACNGRRPHTITFPSPMTVATGSGTNTLSYSVDGVNWTGNGTAIFNTKGNGVATNGSVWIATGSVTNTLAYSTNGTTWRGLGTSIFSVEGKGVAWNGSMWVAVGSGTNSIAYSYDGITWIGLGSGILTQGNGIAWSGSVWVAVGSGTHTIAYSYNGITWTGLGNTIFGTQGNGIAWNGSMWVAVGSGINSTAYSNDGIRWIGLDTIYSPSAYLPFENSPTDSFSKLTLFTIVGTITYSNSIRKVGSYSAYFANTASSNIADNYIIYTLPTSFYNPTAFTISFWVNPSAINGYTGVIPVILHSDTQYEGIVFKITSDRRLELSFGTMIGSPQIVSSTEIPLNSWTHVLFTFSIVNDTGIGTLYINGIFQINAQIAGASYLGIIGTGAAMTRLTLGCNNDYISAYEGYIDDVRIYTVALPPSIITLLYNTPSQIYINETPILFTTSGNSVAWNGDRWVAVGSGGNTIVYSTDGITWTPAASSCFTTAGNGVTWNGSQWIATGSGTNTIGYSSDGSTWYKSQHITPNQTSLNVNTWINNGVTWIASASSNNSVSFPAHGAFNNYSGNVPVYSWASPVYYNIGAGGGAYTRSPPITTTVQRGIGPLTGEWLQLQSSVPLVLSSYTYGCGAFGQFPKTYYIVGSNNNATWYPIQSCIMTTNPLTANFTVCGTYIIVNQSGTQTINGGQAGSGTFTIYPPYTTTAYSYFRIIGQTLWDTGTNGNMEIGEWYLNFNAADDIVLANYTTYSTTAYGGATVTTSTRNLNAYQLSLVAGSSQYLQTANFTPTINGLSFSFWYKSNASGSWARIFDFGNASANNNIFCSINSSGLNSVYFENFYGAIASNTTLNDINYNDNVWRHITWTLTYAEAASTTSTWKIYINGALKTTATSKSYPNTAVTRTLSYIGRSNWAVDQYYNGMIDDFRIYNNVLTDQQVTAIYSDSGYTSIFSTAGASIASNNNLSGTVFIQHPIIAVGQGTHTLAYSPDGVQWTGLGTSIFDTAGYGVAWNGSLWVAVGSGNNHTIAYSIDGLRWIGLGTFVFSQGNGIAWNGSLWVAVGNGTNKIAYSADGLVWIGSTTGNAIFTSANSVAWNGKQWVAVGQGANSIAYSADGIAWTAISSPNVPTQGNSIAWTGSLWVVVGSGTNRIASSVEGTTWTESPTGNAIFTSAHSVTWNGVRWIAVGQGTSHTIAYSDNGTTWTGLGNALFSTAGYGVCWTGTRFVAVGQGTTIIAYSQDGLAWYPAPNGIFTQGNGIAGNPRIGATVCDSQIVINASMGGSNTLDIVSDTYYNKGYTNFSATIQAQTYASSGIATSLLMKTLPDAPTEVFATPYPSGAATGMNVFFTYPTNVGGGIDLYYVSAIDTNGIQPTVTTSSSISPIHISGLVLGTTYRFTVYSSNSAGQSIAAVAVSNLIFQITPGVPTSVTSTLTPTGNPIGVLVSFTPPVNLGGGVSNYIATAYLGATAISSATGPSSPLTITGLTAGTTYTYSVKATNTAGTSVASTPAPSLKYIIQPAAPTTVSVSLHPIINPTGIRITFTFPSNVSGDTVTYYARAVDVSPNGQATVTATSTSSPIDMSTGLVIGTTYQISVYSSNTAGQSTATLAASALKYYTIPDAPTLNSVALTPTGNPSGVLVSFTPPVNTGGGVSSYTATAYSGATVVSSVTGPSSPLTIPSVNSTTGATLLVGGNTYTYKVVAINPSGTSVASTNVPSLTYYSKPSRPIIGMITLDPPATPNSVDVSFGASSDTGGGTLRYVASAYNPIGILVRSSAEATSGLLKITGLVAGTIYTYRVVAINIADRTIVSDASDPSVTTTYYTQPSAPTNVVATLSPALDPTGVIVTFVASTNTGGGNLTYTAIAYAGIIPVLDGVLTASNTFTFTSLTAGMVYTFAVISANAGVTNTSTRSAPLTYYTKPVKPIISSVTLQPSTNPPGVNVNFTPLTGLINTGGASLEYIARAYYNENFVSESAKSSSSPLFITGLLPGFSYSYTIFAINSAADPKIESDKSDPPVTKSYYEQPSAPTNVVATLSPALDPTGVIVTFVASTNTGGGNLTYTAIAYAGIIPVLDGVLTASNTFTFTGLTAGMVYTFVVIASNSGLLTNTSTESAPLTYYTKPATPTIQAITLQPAVTPTGVNIAFTAPTNTTGGNLFYTAKVYDGAVDTNITVSRATSPLYVTGLTAGKAYTYRIFAYIVALPALVSNTSESTVTYYTQPARPTNVLAALSPPSAPTGISVSFTAPTNTLANTGGAPLLYTATAYLNSVATAFTASGSSSPLIISGATSGATNGLVAGTAYTFIVTSSNGALTNMSILPAALTYYTKPSKPTLTGVALDSPTTPTGVNVQFGASTDTGGSTLLYTASAYDTNGTLVSSSAPGETSPLKITGLEGGTTYSYRVNSRNAAVTSDDSTEIASLMYVTIPAKPVVTTSATLNTTTVSWSEPSTNGGSAIASYQVASTPDGYNVDSLPASTTSVTATGLTNGTSYTFTVTATNVRGFTNFGTSSVTPFTLPGVPTGLVGVAASGQITLSWTAPSNNGGRAINGYRIANTTTNTSQTSNTNSYVWTGLTNGLTYSFIVSATNDGVNYGASSSPMTQIVTLPGFVYRIFEPPSPLPALSLTEGEPGAGSYYGWWGEAGGGGGGGAGGVKVSSHTPSTTTGEGNSRDINGNIVGSHPGVGGLGFGAGGGGGGIQPSNGLFGGRGASGFAYLYVDRSNSNISSVELFYKTNSSYTFTNTCVVYIVVMGGGAGGTTGGTVGPFGNGGNAGYLQTYTVNVVQNQVATITIGGGGVANTNGETTTVQINGISYQASGGTALKNNTAGGGSSLGGLSIGTEGVGINGYSGGTVPSGRYTPFTDAQIAQSYSNTLSVGQGPAAFSAAIKYVSTRVIRYFADNPALFGTWTPTKTGSTTNTENISAAIGGVILNDYSNYGYSVEWFGYFIPPFTEEYTFYTTSYTASYVWFGTNAISGYTTANALVNNGGIHFLTEKSGTTTTLTAGTAYPIRCQYGTDVSGNNLYKFSFSSPSVTKRSNLSGYIGNL
jgi:hypothetical protein